MKMIYKPLWNQKRMKLEEILLEGDFLACHHWFKARIDGNTHKSKIFFLKFFYVILVIMLIILFVNNNWYMNSNNKSKNTFRRWVIKVILASLEASIVVSTSMAWEGKTRSLGTTRTSFTGLVGVVVVIPITLLKKTITTWRDFSPTTW
jgi:hypothetical protein